MSATYTGKNVDAAIQKAAKATGIEADSLNYEVLAGQTGGFALIRVVGKKVAQAPIAETLTGEAGAGGSEEAPRRDRGGDRGDRGGDRGGDRRGGDRGGDRGGRGGDRGGDRGGRGGDRGARSDRGDRGDRGDRPRREPREEFWPVVVEDGGAEVTVSFAGEITQEGRDAADLLKTILEKMGFGLALKVTEDESRVVIDLQSEIYAEHFEARELELTQSLEVLVDKGLPFLEGGKSRKKLTLDVNGEKARAEVELATTARTFAEKAIAQEKIFKLGPLDPRDRRIVHMTLKGFPGVVTRSEGEGLFRRVGIIPDALAGGDDDQG